MANMSFDTLLDALPYTDAGYDEPGAKQLVIIFNKTFRKNIFNLLNSTKKVMSQIEEEMRRYRPSKNYLEVFGPINYNAFLVNNV